MENIIDLFPLEGEVTEEILELSDIRDCKKCIGARTLELALKNKSATFKDVVWGRIRGGIISQYRDDDMLIITTEDRIDMITIKKPTKVTFIIE